MTIEFYTSSADIAGDPSKLLYAETDCGLKFCKMYSKGSWFFGREWARKKLIKEIAKHKIEI